MAELTKLTTNINLEMSGDTKRYLVSAKQGDKATRFIVAKLLNNGEPYTIPTGARVVINISKPDGKHVYNTCSYSGSDVTVELTNQALAASGTAYCDIEIRTSNNSQIITSASFTMEIEKSQRSENAILSANEFTELEDRIAGHIKNIDDTDVAVKKAEAERTKAENARVDAENKRATAESIRQKNENTRIQQEQERQQNTSQAVKNAEAATAAAQQAETERVKAENARVDAESKRATAETVRKQNENTRIQQEQERQQNTSQAVKNAEAATAAAQQAETERVKAENTRVDAESKRATAETVRKQNENTRIQQEQERQQNTSQAVKNAEAATAATQQATKDCEQATDRAESALQNQEQLEATLNTATLIRQEVSQMQSAVIEAQKQVEQDKQEIDETIRNSLLASAEKILESVQDYFNRAEALYSSMYIDCDGETPYLRTVTPIFIDGATPQVRNANEGIDFDGGTPTSRLLAA